MAIQLTISQLLNKQDLAGIRDWLDTTPDINKDIDEHGNGALHYACSLGFTDAVALLLRRRADPNKENSNKATPFHCAALSGAFQLVDMLIRYKGNPAAKNTKGDAPIELAKASGHERFVATMKTALKRHIMTQSSATPEKEFGSVMEMGNTSMTFLPKQESGESAGNGSPPSAAPPPMMMSPPSGPSRSLSPAATGRKMISMRNPPPPQPDLPQKPFMRANTLLPTGSIPLDAPLAEPVPSPVLHRYSNESHASSLSAPGTIVQDIISELMAQNQSLDLHLTTHLQAAAPPPKPAAAPRVPTPVVYLCTICEGPQDQKKEATLLCDVCEDECFCEDCWADEHRSKKTRNHKSRPIPQPTPVPEPEPEPAASEPTPPVITDAHSLLMIQQQMLLLIRQMAQKAQDDRVNASGRAELSRETSFTTPTVAPPPPPPTLTMMELNELTARSALKDAAMQDFLAITRDFLVVCTTINSALHFSAKMRRVTPPARQLHGVSTQTEGRAEGGGRPPINRVPGHAVEVVHGEKHLPGQQRMLLLKWTGSPNEVWVPFNDVAHCDAVVQYLRHQLTTKTPTPTLGEVDPTDPGESALGETERLEYQMQLDALRRMSATGTSRGSNAAAAADPFPPGGDLGAPTEEDSVSPNPDASEPPFPITEYNTSQDRNSKIATVIEQNVNETAQASSPDARPRSHESPSRYGAKAGQAEASPKSSSAPADTAGSGAPQAQDEAVVRKYEDRLKALEERHKEVKSRREEHEKRLAELRTKQVLTSDEQRQLVHSEYEANQDALKAEQPHLEHPLYLTNDRHAALLLHKLHQEIAQAETEKAMWEDFERKQQDSAASSSSPSPSAPVVSQKKSEPPAAVSTTKAPPRAGSMANGKSASSNGNSGKATNARKGSVSKERAKQDDEEIPETVVATQQGEAESYYQPKGSGGVVIAAGNKKPRKSIPLPTKTA